MFHLQTSLCGLSAVLILILLLFLNYLFIFESSAAKEQVGQLLTQHHGSLDWPALLGSLRQLALDANQSGTKTTTAGAVAAEKVRPLAGLFVEVFALSSKISLVLDDASVTDRVAAIFARHADPASLAIAPSAAGDEKNMDGLVQDFAEVVELASVTTLPTLYATVRRCVQVTNDFFAGLLQGESAGGQELLARALQYLASKSDQSQVRSVLLTPQLVLTCACAVVCGDACLCAHRGGVGLSNTGRG